MKKAPLRLCVIGSMLFSGLLLLAACPMDSDSKESEKSGNTTLSRMDIVNATNLFIAPSGSSTDRSAGENQPNKLFKITEDGYIQEVTYTYEDEEGNVVVSTEILSPSSIIVLNNNYLVVCFGYNNNYLVNVNSGACYKYTNDLPNPDYNKIYYRGEYIESDVSGSIYFIANNIVKKLVVDDIDNVGIMTVSAPNDSVGCFGVDQDGNIGYEGRDASGNGVLRYRKSSGGYEVLPGQVNHSGTTFWTGFNGKLYYFNYSNTGSRIKELTSEPYAVDDYGNNNSLGYMGNTGFTNILKIKNRSCIIFLGGAGGSECYEVYNSINSPKAISYSTFGMASVKMGIASDDYYYLAGTTTGTPQNVLVKVNPQDNSYTTLLSSGYDIYKMTVTDDSVIIFNALQMSDGAIIIGRISSTGELSILDKTLNTEVTILERIK
jgi:hypothetical protein